MGTPAVAVAEKQAVRRGSHQESAMATPATSSPDALPGDAERISSSLQPSFSSPCLHATRASEPLSHVAMGPALPERSVSSTQFRNHYPSRLLDHETPTGSMPPPVSVSSSQALLSSTSAASRRTEPASKSRSVLPSSASTRARSTGRGAGSGALISASSAVDRRLVEQYERVNADIERIIRSTQTEAVGENGELLKHVRTELSKVKRSSAQMIQSQKELLEKMERQERGGIRRLFSINREHKMEKLRNKLSEKLNQAVHVDEELQRLERQSISLTRMSMANTLLSPMEIDELASLERERDDILGNLISTAGVTDVMDLHSRAALFSSEKKACECVLKQVEQCETFYRRALYLLRIALSTIVSPSYTGGLKEFVLGPYPLTVEASQLIEGAGRVIQPESRRKYAAFAPELSTVRPPKFPQPMMDFAKRGTRCNFDPSNSAAVEAIRKLRTSENIVILMQRIVIQKLELIEKWRVQVERDLERADVGYRKFESRLQAQVAALTRAA
ncbi:hypothetical protein P43SY_006387 [Pythium insidiosum]|uniref:Uncharacterized protein n=1 Tax=Pythium insidiosum TaxID=114742 RepID=A0AAD5MBN3_PYTIN|nr:hypothetical protein ATCC90586_001535 [Pythium insidiosum]KAJ0401832.1 hypothetical protein P43SY_006387 [Pythium insidiosum]